MEQLLDLRFKGDRNYVQGPDIFDQTMVWLAREKPGLTEIDFAFHRLSSHRLLATLGPQPQRGAEPCAVCTFMAAGQRQRAEVYETDIDILGRQPYPEDQIVKAMAIDIDTRSGSLSTETPFTDTEVWVSMTKAVHQRALPHVQGKWLFVRGRFPTYAGRTPGAHRRTLRIAASFNDKLTRSEALLDGVKVGEIFFAIT